MNGPHIPTVAKVMRRMPWASNSLGTIKHKEDLWMQEVPKDTNDDQVVKLARELQSRINSMGSAAEKSYVDRFHSSCSAQCQGQGVRGMTRNCVNELSDPLPTSAAWGRMMYVVGINSRLR